MTVVMAALSSALAWIPVTARRMVVNAPARAAAPTLAVGARDLGRLFATCASPYPINATFASRFARPS